MSTSITIKLSSADKKRLSKLAIRYGLSLPEFSRRVLELLAAEMPSESFRDYENPEALRRSFMRALHDWKRGRMHTRL